MNIKKDNGKRLNLPLRAETETKFVHSMKIGEDFSTSQSHQFWYRFPVDRRALETENRELRNAYTELQASLDRYLHLYDFAPVGYLTLTKDGLIMEANLTSSKLLAVERYQLINQSFEQYFAPKDSLRWRRHFIETLKQSEQQNFELTLQRADGVTFHAQLDCLPIQTKTKHAPMLRITLTSITPRKRDEEELFIAATAFETQDGFIVSDKNKVILRVNQAFSRITGYSAEESIGNTPAFLRSGLHDKNFYDGIWTTTARDGCWSGEIWNKRKNGELFPVRLTITVITDEDGYITHYVGSFIDITLQKHTETTLLNARKRLEDKMAIIQAELKKSKEESTETNIALNVMLKHRETDKVDAQNVLSDEIKRTISPFLKKLKTTSTNTNHTHLVEILETNLAYLVKLFGCTANLPFAYKQLTSSEIQVASMVRQGLSSKLIAATLGLSTGTISIHRKHIRKKLGLNGKANNLHTHLISLAK